MSTKVGKYGPGQPADFSAARVTRRCGARAVLAARKSVLLRYMRTLWNSLDYCYTIMVQQQVHWSSSGCAAWQVCTPRPPSERRCCVCGSVSESLERLGLDYIDVILVHDVEYADDLKQACANQHLTWHAADKAYAPQKP